MDALSNLDEIQEEQYLIEVRKKIGNNCWTEIASAINEEFQGKNRTGKQCRDRFLNFLQFEQGELIHTAWGKEEKEKLFKKF